MELDNIKAKPTETLVEHTRNALNIWKQVRGTYSPYLPDDEFWKASYLAILFHDFGKVSRNFQDQLQAGLKWPGPWLRHEFLSGLFLYGSRRNDYDKDSSSLFAVFAHHKPLNDDLFSKGVEVVLNIPTTTVAEFVDFAKQEYHGYWGEELVLNPKGAEILREEYPKLLAGYRRSAPKLLSSQARYLRERYILHKGILHVSDWTASGGESILKDFSFSYDDLFLKQRVAQKLVDDKKIPLLSAFQWREFQKHSQSAGMSNVIAIAPTGSGKTEAALLWAASKNPENRMVYLLPTRVTSNAIFNRLSLYFGKDYTAVVHSSAIFFRKDNDDKEYDKKKYLKDRCFFKVISVCTIDQMLTQGFNLGYWEMKSFFMLGARVIIDEIHLYQPYTLGLVVSSIKYLRETFQTKFYVMTATMPKKLRLILEKALGEPLLIEDTELLNRARNVIETRDKEIQQIETEILDAISSSEYKKVLVVVNTVDAAIDLFENIKGKIENTTKIICYHSRFIQEDRIKKEKELLDFNDTEENGILIATQVVEVSLDIDFDILFTENAPIDALIQRAGRVNRKGSKANTKMIVFKHSEVAEKMIYDIPHVLSRTFDLLTQKSGQRLSEAEYIALVDEVYKDYDVEKSEGYLKGLIRYQQIQEDMSAIKDLKADDSVFTREGLDTETVIPDTFRENLHNASIETKEKHTLSVRRKRYQANKAEKDKDGYRYILGEYSYAKGLTFIRGANKFLMNKATFL